MYFRELAFMVGNRELCTTVGEIPGVGEEVHLEILGESQRYRVARIVRMYVHSNAHTNVTAALGGRVFKVDPMRAEIHLDLVQ